MASPQVVAIAPDTSALFAPIGAPPPTLQASNTSMSAAAIPIPLLPSGQAAAGAVAAEGSLGSGGAHSHTVVASPGAGRAGKPRSPGALLSPRRGQLPRSLANSPSGRIRSGGTEGSAVQSFYA